MASPCVVYNVAFVEAWCSTSRPHPQVQLVFSSHAATPNKVTMLFYTRKIVAALALVAVGVHAAPASTSSIETTTEVSTVIPTVSIGPYTSYHST